ncbi:hypothetical protein CO115_02875 [Candidatus Falkowbacteria bacterium CG_4_9_14_3_um_filter_36_9]|uniref:POTRA domain-containing protein n=1 Tax=Candidatus Falkowbacteria bacterium CG02_land_8_20_14_3_00_36_14 TaxID=1974560 RepID=A0A2M7DPJ7_9BACT|nr:MAG: hypothetical protein COS18_02235 [Candidatus Falkowbacteria bacterium CG02_land_8_20_14_3_00_36_14]PIX12138.1 MAG: hypothetical protein COZ73_00875 [Candidatus Falkowbacteria bacterium CG_4_8_14_3_um_filter_36_11]PJA10191.1 MAG: hypothetical protein COX67_05260 [Candidatus Falkowbacteria bacterium CG_4_10_14_0_2_um_filter_36_22]PJB19364.1 MAG: hypothetical protein CO115_02875 [Candidatus Falkowbacteria bacterium CG_4_9_14_3_um_filter_36_9]
MRIIRRNYCQKKYINPFFRNKKNNFFKKTSLRPVFYFKMSALFIVLIAIIWFFYFSPFFILNKIIINGNDKISQKEIEDIFYKQLNDNRFLIGRQNNLYLFDKNKFADNIKNLYNFTDIIINTKNFHTILISIKDKNYSIVWYENDNHYYADALGNIMAEADPLEIDSKKYPLIESYGGKMIYDNMIKDGKDKIEFIINLYGEYNNNKHNFTIDRFIVDPNSDIIKMLVLGGPVIYFSSKEDINKQTTKLLTIIEEKLKSDFINKKYINISIGDKVYYK